MKTIKAIFIGKNGSLGYIVGKEHTLTFKEYQRGGIWITDQNRHGGECEYSSTLNFFDNWTNIKTI